MMDELVTAYGNRFLVAAVGVSLALICLFIVLRLLRGRAPSPFLRGGRNRQPRLQVLDAAAVDARRRLVLVRRDNIEHLIMIGGPTDIVIESGIGEPRAYLSAEPVSAVTREPAETAIEDGAAAPQIAAARPVPRSETRPEPRSVAPPQPGEATPTAARGRPDPAARPTPPIQPAASLPESARPTTETVRPSAEPNRPAADAIRAAAEATRPGVAQTRPVEPPAAASPQIDENREALDELFATPSRREVADAPAVNSPPAARPERREPLPPAMEQPTPPPLVPAAAAATLAVPAPPMVTARAPAESDIASVERRPLPMEMRAASPPVQPAALPGQDERPAADPAVSEFERILDEEMQLHASRPPLIVPDNPTARPDLSPANVRTEPRIDDDKKPEEANLQNEIARIFGEMSVNRN